VARRVEGVSLDPLALLPPMVGKGGSLSFYMTTFKEGAAARHHEEDIIRHQRAPACEGGTPCCRAGKEHTVSRVHQPVQHPR
jgi:hypothetical protein